MALAATNEALVLADGRIVTPDGRVSKRPSDNFVETPTNTQAQRLVANANRRIADLPALPEQMNTLSVLIMYTTWGLIDTDIAIATGISVSQINAIRQTEAYKKLTDDLVSRIVEQDKDNVRSLFAKQSVSAANRLLELAHDDDTKTALGAVNSILDRAGHRAADIVEHRHRMEDVLRIEIIKADKDDAVPTLTINPLTGVYEDGLGSRP